MLKRPNGFKEVIVVTLLAIAVIPGTMAFAGTISDNPENRVIAESKISEVEPTDAVKSRLHNIVMGILTAWDNADVVCLGEDHGSKNDSDLRIALIEHPDFVRKIKLIIVEFADSLHQDLLDRFALEGEDIPHEKLRAI